MFTKKTVLNVTLAGAMGLAASVSEANLISNGDFESPGFSGPPISIYGEYRYLSNGDNTTLTGWTVADDGIGELSYVMKSGGTYPIFEGSYSVALNQGSSLTTPFSSIAGATYQLSFSANWYGYSIDLPLDPLQVNVAGVTTSFSDPNGMQYFSFVAPTTSSNALLTFSNTSPAGDFRMYFLDSVSITAVPLPAAAWLFGSGLLGLIGVARRKVARSK